MSDKKFIEELDKLDTSDPDFLAKMQEISERIAASRIAEKKKANPNYIAPVDPQDELNCEGCQ